MCYTDIVGQQGGGGNRNMTRIYLLEEPGLIGEELLEKALGQLPDWRRQQAELKKNAADRINTAFSYLLLRKLIADSYGVFIEKAFLIGKNGKPYLADRKDIFFNISHCRTAIAAAVSDKEIGIDVVDYRDISSHLAKRFCTEKELINLDGVDLNEIWCKKEAYSKYTGQGFSIGFSSLESTSLNSFTLRTEKYFLSASGTVNSLYAPGRISPETLFDFQAAPI